MKWKCITGWVYVWLLVGCREAEETAPKAEVVVEEETAAAVPAPAPEAPGEIGSGETVVSGEEKRTVGDRVDRVIEVTGQGLKVAGEKTKEGVATAAEKTGEALNVAGEKTGEGVRKAAEATGGFIKKVGEKIEKTAEESEPEPDVGGAGE